MAGSRLFSLISQLFLSYFSFISHAFAEVVVYTNIMGQRYTSNWMLFMMHHFPTISHLFLKTFLVISHFPMITSHFSFTLPSYFLLKLWIFSAVSSCSWSSQRALCSVCHCNKLLKKLTLLWKRCLILHLNFWQQQICRGCFIHDTNERKTIILINQGTVTINDLCLIDWVAIITVVNVNMYT